MTRYRAPNVGEALNAQLDLIQADLTSRAAPFVEALELRRQRDSARAWAVDQEQGFAEMERRVMIAAAFVADQPCECAMVQPFRRECGRCFLEKILAGDLA